MNTSAFHRKKEKRDLPIIILGVGLFLFLGARYWLAATNKPFNDDETVGLFSAYFSTYYDMFVVSIGGASTSPLFYFVDRLIFELLGHDLHRHWDLRFITRFVHSTYWALASAYVFVWVTHRFQDWFKISMTSSVIIGLGVAFFYHANSFLHIYAIEARGYSIWVSLSTIQLLWAIDLLKDDAKIASWIKFGAVSFLVCMATYTAYAQLALLLFIILASKFIPISALSIPRQSAWSKLLGLAGCILLLSGICSFFYLSKAPMMTYDVKFYFTTERYFDAVFEVLAKTFHHSSDKGLIFTIPFLFFGVGWYFRKKPEFHWLILKCLGMLVLTVFYFYGSKMKGGLWASRYVISLIPAFSLLYFIGLLAISFAFASTINRRLQMRISPFALLIAWSLIEIVSRTNSYQKMLRADWPRLQSRNVYQKTTNPQCPQLLTSPDWRAETVEKLNDTCRGLN